MTGELRARMIALTVILGALVGQAHKDQVALRR